jgi:hypothetical protein
VTGSTGRTIAEIGYEEGDTLMHGSVVNGTRRGAFRGPRHPRVEGFNE